LIECLIYLNEIDNNNEYIDNINRICEHYKQINYKTSNLSNILADYIIKNSELKFFISESNAYIQFQNAKYLIDDETLPEIQIDEFIIGFLVESIDEYSLSILIKLKESINYKTYIFSYEENFYTKNNPNVINLINSENPWKKAENLRSYNITILFFFENFSNDFYENHILRRIYQSLALRPCLRQVIIPYNNLTRGDLIFDYIILDKYTYLPDMKKNYKEKIILLNTSIYLENRNFFNEIKNFEKDLFNYNIFPNDMIIFANFSPSYKISKCILNSWINILKYIPHSILVLKNNYFENLMFIKNYLVNNRISENRVIFVNINNRLDILGYMNHIDFYLDIFNNNGDIELLLCHLTKTPFISLRFQDKFNYNESIISSLGIKDEIIFSDLKEYENYAIRYFSRDSNLYYNRYVIYYLI
jgi:predicted O-linked N-acetylglucosamine transferase (SPINDLY family)